MIESINGAIVKLTVAVLYPVYDALFSGSVRFFWLYLLTGLAIAAFVHYSQHRSDPFYARLTNRKVWTSESAINDYYVLTINSVLKVLVLSWLLANIQVIAVWTSDLLRSLGVTGVETNGDSLFYAFLLTVTLFVVRDAMRFYAHYLMHKIPALWEFHKIHHSAEVLNFFTSERFHPVDLMITSALMILVTSLVNGVFIAFVGDTLTPLTIAGANAFWVVANIFGGILRHSPFPISFGSTIERWIVSPAMHQIHHSDRPEHFDTNMGGTLAIWDRMAGTLIVTEGQNVTSFGIGDETKEFRSLKEIYLRPFVTIFSWLGKGPRAISDN